MNLRERRAKFGETVQAIGQHQQGHHGWATLHKAIEDVYTAGSDALNRLLDAAWSVRPGISDAHLLTLLCVAIRDISFREPMVARLFEEGIAAATRVQLLREVLRSNATVLGEAVCNRSNSFTGARRFLVPQLVVGAFANNHHVPEVRFLDLGTGLGLLPKQLNNRMVFDRFSPGLTWLPIAPKYRTIPLTCRYGIDLEPLPSLDWVRACYGASHYYEERFAELLWSVEQTREVGVVLRALDMLQVRQLARFLREHRFNVVTCNFALFQHDEAVRRRVVECVVENLDCPGLFLSMEPTHELKQPGAKVTGYLAGSALPLHLADVSDAHLLGCLHCGTDLFAVIGDISQ
jgi:hypothetical protein